MRIHQGDVAAIGRQRRILRAPRRDRGFIETYFYGHRVAYGAAGQRFGSCAGDGVREMAIDFAEMLLLPGRQQAAVTRERRNDEGRDVDTDARHEQTATESSQRSIASG